MGEKRKKVRMAGLRRSYLPATGTRYPGDIEAPRRGLGTVSVLRIERMGHCHVEFRIREESRVELVQG